MHPVLDDLSRTFVAGTPHMRESGMAITALSTGRGTMVLPARADWVGDPVRQVLHPGVLTVLADSACGLAVGAALDKRVPYATLDLRMDYLRPAGPDHDVHCEAHCYRLTRSVAFARADVWQADRSQPIATAQATFMLSTPGGASPRQSGAAAAASAVPAWQAPADSLPVLPGLAIPYVDYLGIRMAPGGDAPLFRMPYQAKLIGNPNLPALHGGVVAGFAETAALLHLSQALGGAKLPKGIDFSVDYLRAGRPVETFAACELVRVGARVALVQVRCWQSDPATPIIVARGHFLLTAPEVAADAG